MKHFFDIDKEFMLTRTSLSSGVASAAPVLNADGSAGVDGHLVLPGPMHGHTVNLGSASMQTASLASNGNDGTLIRTGPVSVRAAPVFPHDDAYASLSNFCELLRLENQITGRNRWRNVPPGVVTELVLDVM